MFEKLLVANRGEVACRIIKTAQSMGISCVAVYSEADKNAPHVERADEAVCIGPPPPQESYLNIPSLIAAAQNTGCQVIHPGYGFLSENAEFARAVQDAGLIFVGPSPESIEIMGDKLKAKDLAQSAGVSVIPGTDTALSDAKQAQQVADKIGYPVMLKAAAGGGGKGMRVVHTSDVITEAFQRVSSEAQTAFGDDRIFVEKFIENPRHIELQILADTQGHSIHLGERECSLQRRHQKVIEEAPSPFVNDNLRQAMAEQALTLAKAVGYFSAGTVEFIVGEDQQFYFLEMNTRLQVEHPVTEFITGLDLVEEMLRIAAGEPLRYQQKDITFRGHAIEGRIYAEDSIRGFLPSTGRLVYFRPPPLDDTLRLDTGVEEGSEISPFYDPMIAKLIAYGPDREAARLKLAASLDSFQIRGVETNLGFLSHLLNSQAFKDAAISTTYLDSRYAEGFTPTSPDTPQIPVAAAGIMACIQKPETLSTPQVVLINRTPFPIQMAQEANCYQVSGEGWTQMVETQWTPADPVFQGIFNGHHIALQVDTTPSGTALAWEGHKVSLQLFSPQVAELFLRMPEKAAVDTSNLILSPMPGLVIEIRIQKGDHVKSGQPLAVIEAMKMENIIQAPRDGVVEEIFVQPKESVAVDQKLVSLSI